MADLNPLTAEELVRLEERLLEAIELPGAAVYDFEVAALFAQVAAAEQRIAEALSQLGYVMEQLHPENDAWPYVEGAAAALADPPAGGVPDA